MFCLARKIRQLASVETLLPFGACGQKRVALAVEAPVQLGQEGERVARQNIGIARAHAAAHHDTGHRRQDSRFGSCGLGRLARRYPLPLARRVASSLRNRAPGRLAAGLARLGNLALGLPRGGFLSSSDLHSSSRLNLLVSVKRGTRSRSYACRVSHRLKISVLPPKKQTFAMH